MDFEVSLEIYTLNANSSEFATYSILSASTQKRKSIILILEFRRVFFKFSEVGIKRVTVEKVNMIIKNMFRQHMNLSEGSCITLGVSSFSVLFLIQLRYFPCVYDCVLFTYTGI